MTKVATPALIESQMKLWREGMISLPGSYIDFHKELAMKALRAGQADGTWFIAGTPKLVSDGWCDGMRVISVQVWVPVLQQMRMLKWHDGNQEFFTRGPGKSGSTPFNLDVKLSQNPGKDWFAELVQSRA